MLTETIPAMVVCVLADGSVEFTNRAWQEYTGRPTLQQLRGSGWQTAIHPDDVRGFAEEWNASLASGKPFATEVAHAARRRPISLVLNPKSSSHSPHSKVVTRRCGTLIACE